MSKEICLCKGMNCFGSCLGESDSVIDTKELSEPNRFYNSINKAMERHIEIKIMIIGIDEDIELDLYYFINRKLSIKTKLGMVRPNKLSLIYSSEQDYSNTAIEIEGLNIYLYNSNQEARNIELRFKSLKYIPFGGDELQLIPSNADYKLITESCNLPFQVYSILSKIECIVKSEEITIKLIGIEKSNFIFYSDRCYVNSSESSFNITYSSSNKLHIIGDFTMNQVITINNLDNGLNYPYMLIEDLNQIYIEGNWGLIAQQEKGKIYSSNLNYSPEIIIRTNSLVFSIECIEVKFHFMTDTTIATPIITGNTLIYTLPETKENRLEITFIYIQNSRVSLYSANLKVTISNYSPGNEITNVLPFEVAISDYFVSKLELLSYVPDISSPINTYRILNTRSSVSKDQNDDYYKMLYSSSDFLIIPENLKFFIQDLTIKYTDDSTNIYGLCNEFNILGLIQKSVPFEVVSYSFTGRIPSSITRNLCYGLKCYNENDVVNDLSSGLFNFIISSIKSYQIRLTAPIDDNKDIIINLNNILLSDISLSIIDAHGYNVKILFATNKRIKSLLLNNVNIIAVDTNIHAEKILLSNIPSSSLTEKMTISCDNIESDINSIQLIYRFSGEVKNIFISNVDEIKILGSQYSINDVIIDEKYIPDCTFLAKPVLTLDIQNSQEIQGFSISTIVDSNIKYKGQFKDTRINNGINIDLIGNKCTTILNSNYIHEQISYFNGTISYELDYDDIVDICIYNDDIQKCESYQVKYKYSDFEASKIMNNRINLHLTCFVDVDLFEFNKKQVTFDSIDEQQKIQIDLTDRIDIELTSFTFNNVEASPKEPKEFELGFLEVISSNFVSFENLSMKVSQLTCSFDFLASFQSIYVNNKLLVSCNNNIVEGESKIFMRDSTRLQMTISGECKLIYQSRGIKIGGVSFVFLSENVEIKIDARSGNGFEINGNSNDKTMKTDISINTNARIDFTGSWKLEEKCFNINVVDSSFTLGLGCDIALDICSTQAVNIEALNENCCLYGTVNNMAVVSSKDGIQSNVLIEEIVISSFLGLEMFLIHISSPNVALIVNRIGSELDHELKINFVFAFDEFKIAKLTIIDQLPSSLSITDGSMYFESNVYGNLKNDDQYPILSQNFKYLDIQHEIVLIIPWIQYFNDDPNLTHGFNKKSNVFYSIPGTSVPGRLIFNFFSTQSPSETPYTILYADIDPSYSNTELTISKEEDLENMFDSITEIINAIEITIYKGMTIDYPLPFSFFKERERKLAISIIGLDGIVYVDHFGNCISSLTINSVKVMINQSSVFQGLELLSLDKAEFLSDVEIGQNQMLSIDIRSYQKLSQNVPNLKGKFTNLKIIEANYITFTEEGWIFQEDIYGYEISLKRSEIESVTVESTRTLNLMIEKPRIQTKIHEIIVTHIGNMQQNYYIIIMGPGWGKIKNMDGLRCFLKEMSSFYEVRFNDYPCPEIFIGQFFSTSINIFTNDEIWIQDDFELPSNMFIDLTNFNYDKAVAHGSKIVIKEDSQTNMVLRNNYGKYEIEHIESRDRSAANIFCVEVTKRIEMKFGAFLYFVYPVQLRNVDITLHWRNSTFPSIIFFDADTVINTPESIGIILDDESIDYEEYYAHTYRKSFQIVEGKFSCYDWVSKIHFHSSISFFNDSSDLIFSPKCIRTQGTNEFQLVIVGEKPLPLPVDPEAGIATKSWLTNANVTYISIGVIVLVVIILGISVYLITKMKYERLISKNRSYTVSSTSLDNQEVADKPKEMKSDREEEEEIYEEEDRSESSVDINDEEEENLMNVTYEL